MKKIKFIPALIAVVFALAGVFAFTAEKAEANKKPATLELGWFKLTNAAYPELASSYTYYGEEMPCEGDVSLCAIRGTRNPNTSITTPYQDDVDDASDASNEFAHAVDDVVAFEE
jgi:hypothetical protein